VFIYWVVVFDECFKTTREVCIQFRIIKVPQRRGVKFKLMLVIVTEASYFLYIPLCKDMNKRDHGVWQKTWGLRIAEPRSANLWSGSSWNTAVVIEFELFTSTGLTITNES
jgi:hypothetical protein